MIPVGRGFPPGGSLFYYLFFFVFNFIDTARKLKSPSVSLTHGQTGAGHNLAIVVQSSWRALKMRDLVRSWGSLLSFSSSTYAG